MKDFLYKIKHQKMIFVLVYFQELKGKSQLLENINSECMFILIGWMQKYNHMMGLHLTSEWNEQKDETTWSEFENSFWA